MVYDALMTMVLVHLQKSATQGHCGTKVGIYHLTIEPRHVTCSDCVAGLKRTGPVHLTGAPCGGAGPETAVRREITCDRCRLEGEAPKRPEYRPTAEMTVEDRNLSGVTWTPRAGVSAFNGALGPLSVAEEDLITDMKSYRHLNC